MFSYSGKRLTGFIFAALIPILVILFGVFLLVAGTVLNLSFAITYFLIPLVACALLWLCIFSELRTATKSWLSILLLIVLIVALLFAFLITLHEFVNSYVGDEAIEKYNSVAKDQLLLPSIDSIGNPVSLEYHNYYAAQCIFSWDAYYLICKYDEETYESELQKLDAQYVYQDQPFYDSGYCCEPSVNINGYTFKMLSVKHYDLFYPKNIVLIGHNDDSNEIIYLAYSDTELDYIKSLDGFIKEDCGWEHIR